MGTFVLPPLFKLFILLLACLLRGQVVGATSTVTVYAPCTTQTSSSNPGHIEAVFANDTSPFIAGSPIVQGSPPQPNVLLPAVGPDVDVHDHSNFIPQPQVKLYYAQPDQKVDTYGIQAAYVDMTFVYPTIALEHCGFIREAFCSATTITITISDDTALSVTQQWPKGNFVLTGAGFKGCGPNGVTSTDSRFWVMVTSFVVDQGSRKITLTIEYRSLEDVVTDFDIAFGNQPSIEIGSANTTATTPATAPTTMATQTRSASSSTSTDSSSPSSDEDDFDLKLDNALGFYDSTDPNFYALILPGVDTSDLPFLTSRDLLAKRGFLKKLAAKLASVAKKIPIPPVVKHIAQTTIKFAAKAIAAVGAVIPPINITPIDKIYPISLSAANFGIPSETTYFGSGTPIYKDGGIGVYCIDCGFQGSMHVVGHLSASITKGITQAVLTVNGPLQFGLNAALIASYQYTKSFEKELARVPLTPFNIPDIISIGPELRFGVGLDASFAAHGGVLAGVTVNWNNINVVVDLVKYSGSSVSGLLPNSVTKNVLLQGEISVTGEAYATFGIDFGVSILGGKFAINGGFTDKPGLELNLLITDPSPVKRTIEENDLEARAIGACQGVDVLLNLKNELSADVTAGPFNTQIGINTAVIPITEYCYAFVHPTTTSTTTSTMSTTTSTTTSGPITTTVSTTSATISSTSTTMSLNTTTALNFSNTTTASSNATDSASSTTVSTLTTTTSVSSSTTTPTATASPAANCPVNPLINGDFESGSVAPWNVGGAPGYSSTIVQPGLNSANAFQCVVPGISNGAAVIMSQQMNNLCIGSTYTVSASYQTANNDPGSQFGVWVSDSDGSNRQLINPFAAPQAGSWTTVTGTFTATGIVAQLVFYFQGYTIDHVWQLDGVSVSLVGGSQPTTSSSSSTMSSTATSTSTTTVPTPSDNMDSCPSLSGTMYSAANSDIYELYCALRLWPGSGANVIVTTTQNIQKCAEQCSIQAATLSPGDPRRCAAVVFDTALPASMGQVNCYGLDLNGYNDTLSGNQYDSAILQTPPACLAGTQAVANSGFDAPFGVSGSVANWTLDSRSSVGSVRFSTSQPNILTWNAAQWTTASFSASQTLTLCPGSTYSFSMYYNIQYKTGACHLIASLDGVPFAQSVDFAYDFSGPRPFELFQGSVTATAKTQTLTLTPSCPPGTIYNIFMDDVKLTLGPGSQLPPVIPGCTNC